MQLEPALIQLLLLALFGSSNGQSRSLGRFQEVFAWKQITFNINGHMVLQDRFGNDVDEVNNTRTKRQTESVFFDNNMDEPERNWDSQHHSGSQQNNRSWKSQWSSNSPGVSTQRPTTTTVNPSDEAGRFFIQYNNLPMGVERVGNRLFVTLPRRRHGVPSTLNYLDLTKDSSTRSPGLRPYPDLRRSRDLTSVYRTRADECGRLWMVDTGMLEIPNDRQQVQPPAIVIYDLNTDRQILRYQLKESDLPAALTPTGLASITVDITNNDCANAHAYIPDLATYGLIVFSLRERDSWRLTHNYFHFDPNAGNLNIRDLRFQWNDGIFSITLTDPAANGCKTAYFHAMVGTHEFAVSTCLLKNRTSSTDSDFWTQFSLVGDRGAESQSTMHGYHHGSKVVFFANIARDAITCWNAGTMLNPASIEILARDSARMSYPSDLHVTGEEVWVMANSLPTFAYSRLDTNEYNFFIYRGRVQDLIAGTVCAGINPTGR